MFALLGGLFAAAKSSAGKPVVIIVAVLAFTVVVYAAGYHAHASASKEAQYKAERDAARRDLIISQQATKAAEDMADTASQDAAAARKKADEYAKKLPKGTDADLTDADVKQLRDIRNRRRR